ncbi:MAG: hypothetical protein ACE5IJ_06080, partial [Thermoplasmata archaeon]
FDNGLVELGRFLGFSSWKPGSTAAPDCVWQLGDRLAFLLEGKSEESPEGGVSVQNCRQAAGHLRWAESESRLEGVASRFSILVSPKSTIDPEAVPHAQGLYFWGVEEARRLFERLRLVLADIRTTMSSMPVEDARDRALTKIVAMHLEPESIKDLLLARPLDSL